MTRKRKTPEKDIDRLSERIWQRGRGKIRNKDDYDSVFDAYLTSNSQKLSPKQRQDLKNKTFQTTLKNHKEVSAKQNVTTDDRKNLFASAGITPSQLEFTIKGFSGKRRTFLRRSVVKYKTHTATVYRDNKGRFGRPEKENRS